MAKMNVLLVLTGFCAALCSLSMGDTCASPQVLSQVYTTTEAQMSTETVVVIDFELACKNSPKEFNLFAEFNGRTLPVSRTADGTKYQVSFSAEHKKLPAGRYTVRFFDDDLYAELRRAQRSGESYSNIQTLFDVEISHQGASYGPWIQTEHVAAAAAILVWYLAYTARSQLQS
jgi:translocon-associated protein subunit delta